MDYNRTMGNKGISRNKGEANPFFGKKHTSEELEKMRLAHLGKKRPPRSPEWCRKIAESKKGKMTGNQNPFFGKHHTPETRERISEAGKDNPGHMLNGAKHPNWQGGITNPRKSSLEKKFSRAVLKRDGYICQECGTQKTKVNPLEAHHIKTFARNPDKRFDISNGITLCRNCHIKTDTYGGKNNV